jgi:hypothetical protein
MDPCKIHRTTQPLVHAQGLEGKAISSLSGRGRKMSLTSPLIDRDLSSIDKWIRCFANTPTIHANPDAAGDSTLYFDVKL